MLEFPSFAALAASTSFGNRTMELNPIISKIRDLDERATSLRGYL